MTVYQSPTRISSQSASKIDALIEELTKIDGDPQVVRDIMLSDVDDAVRGFSVFPLFPIVFGAPSLLAFFVAVCLESARCRAHDVGIRVNGGKFRGVRYRQG